MVVEMWKVRKESFNLTIGGFFHLKNIKNIKERR